MNGSRHYTETDGQNQQVSRRFPFSEAREENPLYFNGKRFTMGHGTRQTQFCRRFPSPLLLKGRNESRRGIILGGTPETVLE